MKKFVAFLFPLLFLANVASGAVTATVRWNFDHSVGSNANGGGFDPAPGTGVDMSTGAATNITGASCAGAGNVFTHASASTNWKNNVLNVVSGTNITTTAGSSRFLITDVTGTSVTVTTNRAGTAICTGVSSDGNFNIGGALDTYNSATDDALLEQAVAGNKWYWKYNAVAYSIGGITLSGTAGPGTTTNPVQMIGYFSTFDDNPSIASGNQPTISSGVNALTMNSAGAWHWKYITYTTTQASGIVPGAFSRFEFCKFSNTSGTANRSALSLSTVASLYFYHNEFISTNGYPVQFANGGGPIYFYGNYFHDSVSGLKYTSTSALTLYARHNIFDTMSGSAIDFSSAAATGFLEFENNTIYCAASPSGSSKGFDFASGTVNTRLRNNIITGCVTGISTGASTDGIDENYNDLYGNTTARSNVTAGANSIALDPSFSNAPNGDFRVGANMKAVGFPSAYPGGLSTTYIDLGAIQRLEDYPAVTVVSNGTSYGNGSLTGTYVTVGTASVATGTLFGPSSSLTGTYAATERYTDLDLTKCVSTYSWKYNTTGADNRTGTYVVTSTANTKTGITFGPSSSLTGTYTGSDRWTCPAASSLLSSASALKCDSTTTNLTGTYVDVGAATNVKHDVSYGVGLTGSYRGADLWDVLATGNVANGFSYLSNGSTLVGTLANSTITNTMCVMTGTSRNTRATGVVR